MIRHFCDRYKNEIEVKPKTFGETLLEGINGFLGVDEEDKIVLCKTDSGRVEAVELCDKCRKSLDKWFMEGKDKC